MWNTCKVQVLWYQAQLLCSELYRNIIGIIYEQDGGNPMCYLWACVKQEPLPGIHSGSLYSVEHLPCCLAEGNSMKKGKGRVNMALTLLSELLQKKHIPALSQKTTDEFHGITVKLFSTKDTHHQNPKSKPEHPPCREAACWTLSLSFSFSLHPVRIL